MKYAFELFCNVKKRLHVNRMKSRMTIESYPESKYFVVKLRVFFEKKVIEKSATSCSQSEHRKGFLPKVYRNLSTKLVGLFCIVFSCFLGVRV